MYMSAFVHTYMHIYIHLYMYTCMDIQTVVCLPIYIPKCMHSYSIYDAGTGANPSHEPKNHVALPFYFLVLRNAMVPLMMPSVSHDADTGANGVT